MILVLLISAAAALELVLPANAEECFYEDLKESDTLTLEFQVKTGGFLDIDVRIEDPEGGLIHAQKRKTDGRVTLAAQLDGLYKICLGNQFSSLTQKVIDFDLVTSTRQQAMPMTELDAARTNDVTGIENSIFQLGDGLEGVEKALVYQRRRVISHDNTNNSTHERVLWWSTFEAVMVLVVGVFQVWWMKRFFEVRRHI